MFFLVNFFENWFCDDVCREMNIILIYFEFCFVMERIDMEDCMIDMIFDYIYFLYWCMSKDIFGSEE